MTSRHIKILKDCRFYLAKLYLCNNTPICIANQSIPFALITMLCLLPQSITLFLLIRAVYIVNFDLNQVSSAFAISIGVSQLELIYFSLAANRPTILKLRTQCKVSLMIVRNVLISAFFFYEFANIFPPIGSQTSLKTFEIYQQAEEFNRNMSEKIKKFVVIGLFASYFPATLVSISYLIVGFPSQEKWMLPFPVRQYFRSLSIR